MCSHLPLNSITEHTQSRLSACLFISVLFKLSTCLCLLSSSVYLLASLLKITPFISNRWRDCLKSTLSCLQLIIWNGYPSNCILQLNTLASMRRLYFIVFFTSIRCTQFPTSKFTVMTVSLKLLVSTSIPTTKHRLTLSPSMTGMTFALITSR